MEAYRWRRYFLKFLQMSFITRDTVNIFSNIHGKTCQDYAKPALLLGFLLKKLKDLICE